MPVSPVWRVMTSPSQMSASGPRLKGTAWEAVMMAWSVAVPMQVLPVTVTE